MRSTLILTAAAFGAQLAHAGPIGAEQMVLAKDRAGQYAQETKHTAKGLKKPVVMGEKLHGRFLHISGTRLYYRCRHSWH
jgi:hypothetical protein